MKREVLIRALFAALAVFLFLGDGCKSQKGSKYSRYLKVLKEQQAILVSEQEALKKESEKLPEGRLKRVNEARIRIKEKQIAQLETKVDRLKKLIAAYEGHSTDGGGLDFLLDRAKVEQKKIREYREKQIENAWRDAGENQPHGSVKKGGHGEKEKTEGHGEGGGGHGEEAKGESHGDEAKSEGHGEGHDEEAKIEGHGESGHGGPKPASQHSTSATHDEDMGHGKPAEAQIAPKIKDESIKHAAEPKPQHH